MKPQVRLLITKKLLATLVFCFTSQLIIVTDAQDTGKPQLIRQMEGYYQLLNPSAKQKVIQSSRSLGPDIFTADRNLDLYATLVARIKDQHKGLSSQEIDALVMLVMFELWKSGEEDLKELVNEMHNINQAKENQREYLERLNKQKSIADNKVKETNKTITRAAGLQKVAEPALVRETAKTSRLNIRYTKTPKLPVFKDPGQMSTSELEQAIKTANANLATLSDISQLDQYALQETQQRQQQILQAISNIMKNNHDTAKSIIQNMK